MLKRGEFWAYSMKNIVVEDQFSNEEPNSKSRFIGDSQKYFPIQYTADALLSEPILTTNYTSMYTPYVVFKYSINELTIDDNMWMYSSRSAGFLNMEPSRKG